MLSEEEKQELKALARSSSLEEEFRLVKPFPRRQPIGCSIEQYVAFLSVLRKVQICHPGQPPFPTYTNIRL